MRTVSNEAVSVDESMLATQISWRPTALQRYLILAGTESDPELAAQFWQWALQQADILDLEVGEQRLLPLIHHNLNSAGRDGAIPHWSRLAAIHRREWIRNQQVLLSASPLLVALAKRHVRFIVLKGAALGQTVYPDIGTRPMSDLDLLVSRSQAEEIITLLHSLGFSTAAKLSFGPSSVAAYSAMNFDAPKPSSFSVDLHWKVNYCELGDHTESAFDRARPLRSHTWGGIDVLQLHPEDNLLNAIAHGMRWNVVSPCRWIVDSLLILRSARGDIQSERLVATAYQRGILSAVIEAAGILEDFGIDRTRLLGSKPPQPKMRDRFARVVWSARPSRLQSGARLLAVDYVTRTHGESFQTRFRSYPQYLRMTCDARTWPQFARNLGLLARHGPSVKATLAKSARSESSKS